MQERRNDHRLLCADLVEVAWSQAAHEHRRVANLEDISLTGLCVQMEIPLESGTEVVVRYGDGELIGVVRYCTYRYQSFFLGVELEERSRWSTQHYQPRHLLDPREMVQNTLMRHEIQIGPPVRPN